MSRLTLVIILALSISLTSSTYAFAGGLSSTFVEVKLEDLEPGKAYSIKQETNKSLVVINTTKDKTVDLQIVPEVPVDYNLVPGYEPIPELSWIKIEKGYFKDVGPNKHAETDITITIPKNERYYGKKYQVYIYSHTAGKATFRMGLMSRILLHIKPRP